MPNDKRYTVEEMEARADELASGSEGMTCERTAAMLRQGAEAIRELSEIYNPPEPTEAELEEATSRRERDDEEIADAVGQAAYEKGFDDGYLEGVRQR